MAVKTIKIDKQNLKVGYQDIELQIATPDFKKDILTDCYGQYIQRENVIQIQSDLTKLDEVNTVLHELFHAIAYISGETGDGGVLHGDSKEERLINSFTNYFVQVLRDNKWLLPYLQKNLLDKSNK
tara:strand:- start:903 stop:1280 length:378 start_codon:yes stop_codon:yes gene_type:complete